MQKSYRVKREQDFKALFNSGQSCANKRFVVYSLDQQGAHFRLGLSVSKKLGNAVTRNTIKRRLRRLIQELAPRLKPLDLVIIARKGVEQLTYEEMRTNLIHVITLAKLFKED